MLKRLPIQVERLKELVRVLFGPLDNQVTGAQVGGRVLSGEGVSSGETGRFQGGAITKDACQEITGKGGDREEVSQGRQVNGQTRENSLWRGLSHVEPPSYHTNNITNLSEYDCNLGEFWTPAIVKKFPSSMTVNPGWEETRKGPVMVGMPELHTAGPRLMDLDINNHNTQWALQTQYWI